MLRDLWNRWTGNTPSSQPLPVQTEAPPNKKFYFVMGAYPPSFSEGEVGHTTSGIYEMDERDPSKDKLVTKGKWPSDPQLSKTRETPSLIQEDSEYTGAHENGGWAAFPISHQQAQRWKYHVGLAERREDQEITKILENDPSVDFEGYSQEMSIRSRSQGKLADPKDRETYQLLTRNCTDFALEMAKKTLDEEQMSQLTPMRGWLINAPSRVMRQMPYTGPVDQQNPMRKIVQELERDKKIGIPQPVREYSMPSRDPSFIDD